nr:RING-H2 finger protein ATL80 [Tanacetum cinerariifolium]
MGLIPFTFIIPESLKESIPSSLLPVFFLNDDYCHDACLIIMIIFDPGEKIQTWKDSIFETLNRIITYSCYPKKTPNSWRFYQIPKLQRNLSFAQIKSGSPWLRTQEEGEERLTIAIAIVGQTPGKKRKTTSRDEAVALYYNWLETRHAQSANKGLKKMIPETLPTVTYSASEAEASESVICLTEFKADDEIKVLPT